ncbi:MAG: putative Ig domain-containing protein [Betaproteobacteria bacterium]|nr:putative Ig domain-containing protein [Betaproteobacteria bacterium]
MTHSIIPLRRIGLPFFFLLACTVIAPGGLAEPPVKSAPPAATPSPAPASTVGEKPPAKAAAVAPPDVKVFTYDKGPTAPRGAASQDIAKPVLPPLAGSETTSLRSTAIRQKYENNLAVASSKAQSEFTYLSGEIPPGLDLAKNGRLSGVPTQAGIYRFVVKVQDPADPAKLVQQSYRLSVYLPQPSSPPAGKTPAANTAGDWDKKTLPAEDAKRSIKDATSPKMVTYLLDKDDVKALTTPPKKADGAESGDKDDASPPRPAPAKKTDDPAAKEKEAANAVHADQRKAVLERMVGIEYPSEHLFREALRATVKSAVDSLSPPAPQVDPPPVRDTGKATTTPRSAPAVSPPPAAATITLGSLFAAILPPEQEAAIVDKARKERYFDTPSQPILWDGSGCGCIQAGLQKMTYGFYPFWEAQPVVAAAKPVDGAAGKDAAKIEPATPQPVDFSLMKRIAYAGVTFDDNGSLVNDMHWTDRDDSAGFAREARRHGSKLDLVLYRADWKALLANENKVDQVIANLPGNALARVDAKLQDWRSQLKTSMSFLEPPPTMGDGLTVYFEGVDKEDGNRFAAFFERFMPALIDKMREHALRGSQRGYALNVVIPDEMLDKVPAYRFNRLFGYLVRAEGLTLKDNRITENIDIVEKTNKFSLHYLILLSEPTTDSKKNLRRSTEYPDVPSLKGSNREFFLRSLVPVVTYNGMDDLQFVDDLIYFKDNFGGVALCPLPLNQPDPAAGANIYRMLGEVLVGTPESAKQQSLCSFICLNRWWLRVGMLVALLVGIVAWSLRIFSCHALIQSDNYFWFLIGGGVLMLLPLIAMLNCDIYLREWLEQIWTARNIGLVAAASVLYSFWQARNVKPPQP